MAIIQRNSSNVIFSGMSSFWTAFFEDSPVLQGLDDATASEIGNVYLELMENLLNISIKDAPVYSKKDWKLLILDNTKMSFDPAIFSWGETNRVRGTLRFTARELSPLHDRHTIQVSDLRSLSSSDKPKYPVAGIYNKSFLYGSQTHAKSWVYLVPDDARVVDAVALLNRRFISNMPVMSYALTEDVQLGLSRNGIAYDVLLPSAVTDSFTHINELVQAFQTVVNASGIPGVTVSTSGNFLFFEAQDGDLKLVSNNDGAEKLYLKAFPFDVIDFVPRGREDTFIWSQSGAISVRTGNYRAPGTEYRFAIDDDVREAKFIYNSLYDPAVILETTRHYRIERFDGVNYIYFVENPFEFTNVAFRDMGTSRQIALWMSEISRDKLDLYKNYGYIIDVYEESTVDYKNFLRGVFYYFMHGPQVTRVASCLNIISGIPVVSENNEIVLGISTNSSGHNVTTDKNQYVLPLNAEPSVTIGQTLMAFDVLTNAFAVEDYINSPNWYTGILIPEELMPGSKPYLRVSVEHINVPAVGNPGYIIGDLNTASSALTTSKIASFVLTHDCRFTVEFDSSGVRYPVVVRASETTGNTSLEHLVINLRESFKQLRMATVQGTGVNIYRLGADAEFSLTQGTQKFAVKITSAATQNNVSMTDLLKDVNNALINAGVKNIKAMDLTANQITFVPDYALDYEITSPNLTAQAELGIQAAFTPRNYKIAGTLVPYASMTISSETFGSKSSVAITEITDIDTHAEAQLGFTPFVPGSGDYIGNDGDPSIGWRIFDEYLKYNLFRIRYDLSVAPAFRSLNDLTNIVIEGRPIYTFALTTPQYYLKDTVAREDSPVVDVRQFATQNDSELKAADALLKMKAGVVLTYPRGQWHQYVGGPDKLYTENFQQKISGFTTQSDIGGTVVFKAKDGAQTTYKNHVINLRTVSMLAPDEVTLYSYPGIYNEGRVKNGVSKGPFSLQGGTVSGLYQRHEFLLFSEESTVIHPHATAFLAVDRATNFDLAASTITEGQRLLLADFVSNSQEVSILNISNGVMFKDRLCDLFWYTDYRKARTTGYMGDPQTVQGTVWTIHPDFLITPENQVAGTLPIAAKFSILPGTFIQNKNWFFVVPDGKTIKESVAAVLAATGNDEKIFPFKVEPDVLTEQNLWAQTAPLAIVTQDLFDPRLMRGDLYALFPDPTDGVASTDAFFIGNEEVLFEESTGWKIGVPQYQFYTNEGFSGELKPNSQAWAASSGSLMYGTVGQGPTQPGDCLKETYGVDTSVPWNDPRLKIGGMGVVGTGDPHHPGNTFYIGGPQTFAVIGGDTVGGSVTEGNYSELGMSIQGSLRFSEEQEAEETAMALHGRVGIYDDYAMVFTPAMFLLGDQNVNIGTEVYITDGHTETSADILTIHQVNFDFSAPMFVTITDSVGIPGESLSIRRFQRVHMGDTAEAILENLNIPGKDQVHLVDTQDSSDGLNIAQLQRTEFSDSLDSSDGLEVSQIQNADLSDTQESSEGGISIKVTQKQNLEDEFPALPTEDLTINQIPL